MLARADRRLRLRQPRDPRPQARAPILDEQLEPALALEPDLVTIYAGANDILRPRSTSTRSPRTYDDAHRPARGDRRQVVLFTAFDPGGSAIYRPLRGRFALYNEWVREIADRHGATLVDIWRMRDIAIAGVTGHRPDAPQPRRPPADGASRCSTPSASTHDARSRSPSSRCPLLSRREPRGRRTRSGPARSSRRGCTAALTGRSSGDSVAPKRPGLTTPPVTPSGSIWPAVPATALRM